MSVEAIASLSEGFGFEPDDPNRRFMIALQEVSAVIRSNKDRQRGERGGAKSARNVSKCWEALVPLLRKLEPVQGGLTYTDVL